MRLHYYISVQEGELVAQHVNAIHTAAFYVYPPSFFSFGIRHSLTHLAMSGFINLSAPVTASPLTPFMLCGCPVIMLTLARSHRCKPSVNNFCAFNLSDVIVQLLATLCSC